MAVRPDPCGFGGRAGCRGDRQARRVEVPQEFQPGAGERQGGSDPTVVHRRAGAKAFSSWMSSWARSARPIANPERRAAHA
jgi:hypothetical protein